MSACQANEAHLAWCGTFWGTKAFCVDLRCWKMFFLLRTTWGAKRVIEFEVLWFIFYLILYTRHFQSRVKCSEESFINNHVNPGVLNQTFGHIQMEVCCEDIKNALIHSQI